MRLFALLTVLCLSCGPGFDRSIALVSEPTVLAVRADPPESAPGASVTYTALAATSDGAAADADIVWSFCSTPPALTEDSSVSQTCVLDQVEAVASGPVAILQTPRDACRRFGPLGMPAQAGGVPLRPAPADATGGFYQPVRLGWHDRVAIAMERLTCDPTGISLDLSQAYRAAHRPNRNPSLLPLAATIDGLPADLGALSPGAVIGLVAGWMSESAERYVTADAERGALVEHDERLWVAWFATAGSLDRDVTAPEPSATTVANRFFAPATAGVSHLWAVLHDDRGGADFTELLVLVR